MTTDLENLDSGFAKIFDALFARKAFCKAAIVTKFDAATQTVSVQPANKTLFQGETVPRLLPIIEDVPVIYPGGGTFFVTFDILVGSFVLLVFSDRSIENFMTTGAIADPQSTRKCDLSDAIAIPGILPLPSVLVPPVDTAALTLRNKLKTCYITINDTQCDINGNLTVLI